MFAISAVIFIQIVLNVSLFELDFALLAFACIAVLDFQFREEAGAFVEGVAEEQHEAVKIDFVFVGCTSLAVEVVVVQFAVAADADFLAHDAIPLAGLLATFSICSKWPQPFGRSS